MIYVYDYNYKTLTVGSNFNTSLMKDQINFTTEHYSISQEYVKVRIICHMENHFENAYSNILQISPSKTESFQIKNLIILIFLSRK